MPSFKLNSYLMKKYELKIVVVAKKLIIIEKHLRGATTNFWVKLQTTKASFMLIESFIVSVTSLNWRAKNQKGP